MDFARAKRRRPIAEPGKTAQQQAKTNPRPATHDIAFSPDGQRLASASWAETIKVWDVATGQELLTLTGHTNTVYGVAFSPDGQWLYSPSQPARGKSGTGCVNSPDDRKLSRIDLISQLLVEV